MHSCERNKSATCKTSPELWYTSNKHFDPIPRFERKQYPLKKSNRFWQLLIFQRTVSNYSFSYLSFLSKDFIFFFFFFFFFNNFLFRANYRNWYFSIFFPTHGKILRMYFQQWQKGQRKIYRDPWKIPVLGTSYAKYFMYILCKKLNYSYAIE